MRDPKDNGSKNAYMLNFAPYEERTVKIGFMNIKRKLPLEKTDSF